MQHGIKQVSRYGFGLMALSAFFLLTVLLLYPYSKLQLLFQQFNAEKETLFPWNDFTGTYGFSEKVYWTALFSYLGIAAGSLFLFFLLQKRYGNSLKNSATGISSFFYRKFTTIWRSMPVWERWIVFLTGLLLITVRLYFLLNSRIGQDEAASYIFFISKGLPGITMYYPLPNNHIFYNLLCLPLRYVFKDPFWTLELPTLLLSIFGSAIIYLAYRRVLPFGITFFGLATFYFSQYAVYFSVHGRGYFLVSICAAVAALGLYKLYERSETHYWLVFIVASVIGFYTIPVYLLPFSGLLVFGAIALTVGKMPEKLKALLLACGFIGATTALLYTPVLLASGPELLLGNRYVNGRPFADFVAGFPFLFSYTQGSIVGQETYGFYLWLLSFAGISGLLLLQKPLKNYLQQLRLKPAFLFLIWCCQWVPWAVIFWQRVRPPERVLFYKGFFDLLALAIVIYAVGYFMWRRFPKLALAGFGVLLLGFGAYQANKVLRNEQVPILMSPGFDARLQEIVASGADTIYANEIYYSGNLRYELFKQRPKDVLLSEFLFNPAVPYEVVILDQKGPPPTAFNPKDYQVFHEDAFVKILFRKSFSRKSKLKVYTK